MTYTLKRDYIRLAAITYPSFGLDKNKGLLSQSFVFGGDDGSRTHVRKSIPETFYERSLSFKIPLGKRR